MQIHVECKKVILHVIIGFSVLANWFFPDIFPFPSSFSLSSLSQITWSSVNSFLSFCWHNIEVLIGQWWSRKKVMRDSVKNSRLIFDYNYRHSSVFYGEKCEITISLPWKLLSNLTVSQVRELRFEFQDLFLESKQNVHPQFIFSFWCFTRNS